MAQTIPVTEIAFNQTIDPNGKLFWWHGEPFRAVRRHHAAFTNALFARGHVSRWVADGWLVPTRATDWVLPGFPLVLQHTKIPFSARAEEWSAPMFRDAALALLDLEQVLEADGLMLQDGHTGNLLFDGARPVFVDFCSIIPNIPTPVWVAEDEFRRNFLHPLRLMSAGQSHVMRWMMPFDSNGLSADARIATPSRGQRVKAAGRSLIPTRIYDRLKHDQRVVERHWAARRFDSAAGRTRRLADLRAQIAALTFPEPEGAAWPAAWPPERQMRLRALLDRLRPATVLALGDAEGAQLAARAEYAVALFARDEAESERCYRIARAEHLPLLAVRPLARDAHEPWSWRDARADRDARFRAELVLAAQVRPPDAPEEQSLLLNAICRLTRRWLLLDPGWNESALRRVARETQLTDIGLLVTISLP
jgi:hypothetical protein